MLSRHFADIFVTDPFIKNSSKKKKKKTPQINPVCFLFPDGTLTNKEFHMFYFANLEELIKNSRNKLLSKSTYILKIPGGIL